MDFHKKNMDLHEKSMDLHEKEFSIPHDKEFSTRDIKLPIIINNILVPRPEQKCVILVKPKIVHRTLSRPTLAAAVARNIPHCCTLLRNNRKQRRMYFNLIPLRFRAIQLIVGHT